MDAHQAWQSVLGQLQMEMPRASFDTWVRDTEAVSIEEDVMTVSARNAYACDWLESRLKSTVQRLLVGILRQSVTVQFVVQDALDDERELDVEEEETEISIEPVQWLDYDRIVQPHKQVVVKGYLRRLGMEIGPKALWLYIGFHQAAWKAYSDNRLGDCPLYSADVLRFSGFSNGAFWRLMKQSSIQKSLIGLVQRTDPTKMKRFRRGRDSRPHRAPVRYQVCMTPRLTRADSTAIHAQVMTLLKSGKSILDALQELLAVENVIELLTPVEHAEREVPLNTVMDIVRIEAGDAYTPEIDQVAQLLHRRITNCLGDIHIPHYFITHTIHAYRLTPAQAWLITVARDMAYVNSRTGERREVVTFKRGFLEMAELIGSRRYKTVQAWFNPQWEKQCRGGDLTCFLGEQDSMDTSYCDLRVASMPRTFRVLLDEPLDATGSISVDADGSDSQTRMGVLADADGSNMADANGSALNSFKHPVNTRKNNTSSIQQTSKAAGAVPAFWELKTLLQQNNVHPKVTRELLETQVSVRAFVSWVLFAASPSGGKLSDPLGYAISRMREDALQEARGLRQFAELPPAELLMLINSTPTQPYELPRKIDHPLAPAWTKAMGSHNSRLKLVRGILFGEGANE